MARPIWCRWEECRTRFLEVAGIRWSVCPKCGEPAMWSAEPGQWLKRRPFATKGPRVPFDLNGNDRRLLQRLRIKGES